METIQIGKSSARSTLVSIKDLIYEVRWGRIKMRDVIYKTGMSSAESIATELSSMLATRRTSFFPVLQCTHGNWYVQRVVAQAKLKMGQIGDIYEDEVSLFLNWYALFSSLALVTISAKCASIQLREQRNWRGH